MCKCGMNINLGNFRDRRDWSREALDYAFSKHDRVLSEKVEKKLVHDVFLVLKPDQLKAIGRKDKKDESDEKYEKVDYFETMSKKIQSILALYGNRDMIYVDSNVKFIPPSLARQALEVCSKGSFLPSGYSVFLVREKCSMSLYNFLIAMICDSDGMCIPPEVIEEWSAIPEDRQSEIYDDIIEFIRRNITGPLLKREEEVVKKIS